MLYYKEEKYIAMYPSTETTNAKATARKNIRTQSYACTSLLCVATSVLCAIVRVEDGELPDAAELRGRW